MSVMFWTITGNGNDFSDLTSSIMTLCSWVTLDFFRFSPHTLPTAVRKLMLWFCAIGFNMSVMHFLIVNGCPSIQVYCCWKCCGWLEASNKIVKPFEPFELSNKLHRCHTCVMLDKIDGSILIKQSRASVWFRSFSAWNCLYSLNWLSVMVFKLNAFIPSSFVIEVSDNDEW